MPLQRRIELTEENARLVEEAMSRGAYQSVNAFLNDAMREWLLNKELGRLWDEGLASGLADPGETIEDIKAAARLLNAREL